MYEIYFDDGDVEYFDSYLEGAIESAKESVAEGEEWAVFSETGELVAKSDGCKLSKERALKTIRTSIDAIQSVAGAFEPDKAINIGVFKDSAFAFMLDDSKNEIFAIHKHGDEWFGLF